MTLTRSGLTSHSVQLTFQVHVTVRTPQVLLPKVWPLPLSLATTRRISFDFSSSRYLDVSVPGVPLHNLLIQLWIHGSSPCVFPHSEIRGSKLICSSPRLIAASHVLRRLPMPRHSPYALSCLNYLLLLDFSNISCSHDCLNCCDHTYFSYLVNFRQQKLICFYLL